MSEVSEYVKAEPDDVALLGVSQELLFETVLFSDVVVVEEHILTVNIADDEAILVRLVEKLQLSSEPLVLLLKDGLHEGRLHTSVTRHHHGWRCHRHHHMVHLAGH